MKAQDQVLKAKRKILELQREQPKPDESLNMDIRHLQREKSREKAMRVKKRQEVLKHKRENPHLFAREEKEVVKRKKSL